jgi:hypothetical protein
LRYWSHFLVVIVLFIQDFDHIIHSFSSETRVGLYDCRFNILNANDQAYEPVSRFIALFRAFCQMGNVGANPATLVVRVDQSHVTPGSLITGKAYLSVHSQEVDCTSLEVWITGTEITQVRYSETHGTGKKKKTVHKTARQSSRFLNLSHSLAAYPGKVTKGHYEYPFALTLPAGIPSSFRISSGSDKATVEYRVDVGLHRVGWMTWSVKDHLSLVVESVPNVMPIPITIDPQISSLITMCCINRGKIAAGGYCSKNVLCEGDSVEVSYAVRNFSSATIKAVSISLVESVSWRAQGHRADRFNTLFSKRIDRGIPKNNEAIEVDPSEISTVFKQLQAIYMDSGKMDHFVIPASFADSYHGGLITVNHQIQIAILTAFGTSNIVLARPVYLFRRKVDSAALELNEHRTDVPTALPVNWSAVAAPVVAIPLATYATPADANEDEFQPSAPKMFENSYDGFASLVRALRESFDQCGELRKWLEHNPATAIAPGQYYELFRSIRYAMDQLAVAQILSAKLDHVTCALLAEAARGSMGAVRRDVVESLIGKLWVSDKENKSLVSAQLGQFEFVLVEGHFE